MEKIGEKLRVYFKDKGITQEQLASQTGVSQAYINALLNDKKEFGKKQAKKWNEIFGISPKWLLTGDGDMFDSKQQFGLATMEEEIYFVPLLPITAQGGSLNDFIVSVKDSDCERVVSPIKGADFAITVSGDSMAPEFPNGSQILIKKINEKAFIDWGKTYVLDTCNGTVIKTLVPSENKESVKCVSINPDPKYAAFEVAFENIYGVYRVMMCMSVK